MLTRCRCAQPPCVYAHAYEKPCTHVKDPVVHVMTSELGGLWKHENNQYALVAPKIGCGCPSGGGIENSRIRYPSYGGTQKKETKKNPYVTNCAGSFWCFRNPPNTGMVCAQTYDLTIFCLWPFFLKQSLSPSDKQPLYPPSSLTLKQPSFPSVDTAFLLL